MCIYLKTMLFLLWLLIVSASAARADADAEDTDVPDEPKTPSSDYAIYETVVVGRRQPEDRFSSDRSVSIVDGRALEERSPRTTPEALWNMPGVFVQQTNHAGGSPILRGMIGPQNLILVDGVRLNNSIYRTGPLQYLNMIDPLHLERIEVLRGPGSVLYGSDAMGGVIQLFPIAPRTLQAGTKGGGGVALGKFASANYERTGHVHLNGASGGSGGLAGFTYKNFDNLTGGDRVGRQPYSGYENISAMGSLRYGFKGELFRDWWAKAVYLFSRISDAGRTDKLYDSNSLQKYDNDDGLLYGRLHMCLPAIRTTAEGTVSWQHFGEQKDNHSVEEDYSTVLSTLRDEVTVDTLGVDLDVVTRLVPDRLRLQYGGMLYRDWVTSKRSLRNSDQGNWVSSSQTSFPTGSNYDNYGGFAMLEGDPLSTKRGHVLRLSGGYRFHGAAGSAPARDLLPRVDFSYYGHVFQGSLQYIYRTKASVAVTFSQGFRSPNLNEAVMLGDTGKYFHIPNPHLKPERSDTVELVVRYRFWRFSVGASGYFSWLEDLIKRSETTWQGQETVNDKAVAWNVNGGNGIFWGIEGELGVDLGGGFSASGNLAYSWGEETVGDSSNIPLTRIPPLFGQGTVRYDTPLLGDWKGFVQTYVRAAGKQDRLSKEDVKDVRIPEGGTPGWWTWNVAAGVHVKEHWVVGVRMENLLNQKTKYHGSGLYSPGINALLSVKATY